MDVDVDAVEDAVAAAEDVDAADAEAVDAAAAEDASAVRCRT